ncbi:MAG TPA: alkaline phosphatase family protein [Acidimicrobiales bacterium]|nr:alkaline phosphatase family protein [Acidimicrobiales bacterium]
MSAELHLPRYADRCISNVVPAIFGRTSLLPDVARTASQVVLLVLDGVGWNQLRTRREAAPVLWSMAGGPITSVAPTTTATALSSIVSGTRPAAHGVVGYRLRVPGDQVLNVLRWRTGEGDARTTVPPTAFRMQPAFGGRAGVPVVTRAEFASTGFTAAMGLDRLVGWQAASAIAVEVGSLLRDGDPFVYAYYDGVDKVAHAHGLGDHYDAELHATDRIVADVVAQLPRGAALVVTSDHGQVDVGDDVIELPEDVVSECSLLSGEGRFTWLHALPGRVDAVLALAQEAFGAPGLAEVLTRDEVVAAGWFGGPLSDDVAARLGDVAVVACAPVAFLDPADTGSAMLRCRHGSLTEDEMLVPLVAVGSPV